MDNQHVTMWRGLICTQKQTRKLISNPSPTEKTRLLSFNRTQTRVVIGLLSGHNTMRRHLYFMGLINSPYVGGVEQRRKPQRTFCMKPSLHSDIRTYLGSLLLNPEDVGSLSLEAIWNLRKGTGPPWLGHQNGAQRACLKGVGASKPIHTHMRARATKDEVCQKINSKLSILPDALYIFYIIQRNNGGSGSSVSIATD